MVLKKNTSIRLELTGGDKKEDLVVTRRGCIASRLHSGSKVREGRGKSRTVTRNSESGLHKIGRAVALTEPFRLQYNQYMSQFFFFQLVNHQARKSLSVFKES